MTKPSDIPQDIWTAAGVHVRTTSHLLSSTEIIARAILAAKAEQREADAKLADDFGDAFGMGGDDGEMLPISPFIAAAIRKGAA